MFVDAYFANNRNASAAARAVGYSPKTAGECAYAILKDPWVKEMIEFRSKELGDMVALTAEEVIRSLARAMRFDPGLMYNEDGTLKRVQDMPDEVRLELEGVDVDQVSKVLKGKKGSKDEVTLLSVTTAKVKFPARHAARDQAMKHFGLYSKDKGAQPEDDGEAPPPVAVTIEFKDARRRKG